MSDSPRRNGQSVDALLNELQRNAEKATRAGPASSVRLLEEKVEGMERLCCALEAKLAQATEGLEEAWNKQARLEAENARLKHAASLLTKSLFDELLESIRADWGNSNVAVIKEWRDEVQKILAAGDGPQEPS